MIKIYVMGVIVYIISTWLAFWTLTEWLNDEYRESEDFKERVDTFTELGQDWFKDMSTRRRIDLVLMGLCPIVHWLVAIVYLALAIAPDKMDWLIREAIDKILN